MILGVISTYRSEGLVKNFACSLGIAGVHVMREPSFGLTKSCDQPQAHSTRSWCVVIHASTVARSALSHFAHAGSLVKCSRAPAQSSRAARHGRPAAS